jgi:hypothetical protein
LSAAFDRCLSRRLSEFDVERSMFS